jgi:hypothetical protein
MADSWCHYLENPLSLKFGCNAAASSISGNLIACQNIPFTVIEPDSSPAHQVSYCYIKEL